MVQIAARAIGIRHMVDLNDAKRWAVAEDRREKDRLELGKVMGKISRVVRKEKVDENSGELRVSYAAEGLFRLLPAYDNTKAKVGDMIDATALFVPAAFGEMLIMEMQALRDAKIVTDPTIVLNWSLSPAPKSAVGYVINVDRLMAQIIDPFASIVAEAQNAGIEGLPQIAAPVDASGAMDAAHVKEAEIIEETISPEALARAGESLDGAEEEAVGPTVPKSSRKK
ncbi:hypothetical protein GC1_00026 [Gluconobacter phage GC1]|uniref:Uncharacterized protein n=1 Tax=Gluconobacter phage GC1 TaxID=2047788 RepID=A0A2I5AR90_9VIRU|nr:hypothetical protein FDJ08_gp26 [Gluconobacter phage GC1]ATS92594.1 hypothetical protein GC1_00026 [Gluconobacter phage GC1]